MARRRRFQLRHAAAAAAVVSSFGALALALAPSVPAPEAGRGGASEMSRAGDPQPTRRDREPRPAARLVSLVPPGRPALHVPILMYHYIRVNPDPADRLGFNLSVTPADFASQMDWLADNGYHPVDFNDLRSYLFGGGVLPGRPVVLTFDDGYRDMYTTAYPILRAHRFKAVAYIVSGFVNSPVNVSADQLLEMDANGIEIGAHTVSHADLTRLSDADLWHEVYDSKVSLEALLGHPVLDFCYPSGRVNDTVARAVATAGFVTATTTQPGAVHTAGDRFLWTRVRVSGGEPLQQFIAGLGPPEPGELVTQPAPAPTPLHGPRARPVTMPLLPPREAPPAAPPMEGPSP